MNKKADIDRLKRVFAEMASNYDPERERAAIEAALQKVAKIRAAAQRSPLVQTLERLCKALR